jgi:hypothetical protein
MNSQSQKDFSKNVNDRESGWMACFKGFDGLLSLGLTRSEGVYTLIGVREALCPCRALYLEMPLYPTVSVNDTVSDTVWL